MANKYKLYTGISTIALVLVVSLAVTSFIIPRKLVIDESDVDELNSLKLAVNDFMDLQWGGDLAPSQTPSNMIPREAIKDPSEYGGSNSYILGITGKLNGILFWRDKIAEANTEIISFDYGTFMIIHGVNFTQTILELRYEGTSYEAYYVKQRIQVIEGSICIFLSTTDGMNPTRTWYISEEAINLDVISDSTDLFPNYVELM